MLAHQTHTIKELQAIASKIRKDIVKMLQKAKSGHPGGALGMVEVLTILYFYILNHDPKKPLDPNRDRLLLSSGHNCPVLYATLARAGYFKLEELNTLRKFGSRLQGHPSKLDLPGIETSSGPLGLGLSQAIGMALASKLNQKKYEVFCLLSDGELNEGQTWEAFMFAGKHKLHNLTAIIDRNNIQIDGSTEDVMPLEPLKAKLEAFNWHVIECNGHDLKAIIEAFHQAKVVFEAPVAIISHTIPGHGVDFMEFDHSWHGQAPDKTQTKEALKDL